jgi:hypothetical protein
VYYLTHAIQISVHPGLSFFQARLGEVDGIAQERASLVNALRIATILELDSLGLQKLAKMVIEFVRFDFFHIIQTGSSVFKFTAGMVAFHYRSSNPL